MSDSMIRNPEFIWQNRWSIHQVCHKTLVSNMFEHVRIP